LKDDITDLTEPQTFILRYCEERRMMSSRVYAEISDVQRGQTWRFTTLDQAFDEIKRILRARGAAHLNDRKE
jgi:hypothetical protein